MNALSRSSCWNELYAEDGSVRPHWRYLYDSLHSMRPAELTSRASELSGLLRENGVTYNIYSENHEKDWPLDTIPLVLPSHEWSSLERGLIQRAELQSRIFNDLHGKRRLLSEGILPPSFLFAHPDWLPAAFPANLEVPPYVPLIGFDLTRGRNGDWRVLSDRVQNPSGAGYALQNRVLLTKIFPSLYRDAGVHRLVNWFRALRAELRAAAPVGVENPHVVLLSPGPGHETWFEHTYLATYLGLTLVRGQELELRGDRIWVRTVSGDRPVDVILRRVNDAWCDPLYFRPDSLLGVPGLVRAVHAKTVTVVNPLGSGVLNNPGMLAYLPRMCRLLMGEDLILPSLPTWWCGEPAGLSHVLENLPRMVLKPTFPIPGSNSILASRLDLQKLAEMRARIIQEPELWVGQEECEHAMAPAWQNGEWVERHTVLRTFACGNPRTGYRVLPGGLTRMGASEGELIVSNQDGGISKDTWILSSEPEREVLNREAVLSVGNAPATALLPATAAENLFWAGRYQERTLVLIRRLREVIQLENGEPLSPEQIQALACATGGLWQGTRADNDSLWSQIISNPQAAGGIAYDIHWLTFNGKALRGIVDNEAMGIVQRLGEPIDTASAVEIGRYLDTLAIHLRALSSVWSDWSTDDPRHIFTGLGQKCEWLDILLSTLRAVSTMDNSPVLRMVLEIDQGVAPGLVLQGENLIHLASADTRRPRSLASTAEGILVLLQRLPRGKNLSRSKPEALALRLLAQIALGDLDSLPTHFNEFTQALHSTYFLAPASPGWLQN